jgi:hypothetical protein
MGIIGGAPMGGGAASGLQPIPISPKTNLKSIGFVDIIISNFYMISPSSKISHGNLLMTSTLQF